MENYFNFDDEMDSVLESVLSGVMESEKSILDAKTRDCLPDKAFGIVYTSKTEKDKYGKPKRYRKYPLVVKSDKELTKRLVSKALTFFNYCKPEYKQELANKIVTVCRTEKIEVTVSSNNSFLKFVPETKLPEYIKVKKVTKKK